jgi:nucleoid-associated protein YgaU
MTKKSDFTSQEWQMITDGPEWVFAALAAADGNVALTTKIKETKAFKNVVEDYHSRSELMAEILDDSTKASKATKTASLSEAEQAIDRISEVLDAKASPSEATEYRRFLFAIAKSVAKAAGEGMLGVGEKLSDNEKMAIEKIQKALQEEIKPRKSTKAPSAKATAPVQKRSASKTPGRKPEAKKPSRPAGVPGRKEAIMMDGGKEKPVKVIATHKVKKNETWTHLTLKYYGHTSEPYWRYLYEFNKELIGDNYKDFYEGLMIEIPELPDHLKDKD